MHPSSWWCVPEELLQGLPPVVGDAPRVLVLGSFPGEESLRRQAYYAHPRNLFWPIMGELVGAGPDLPYPARLQRLAEAGIALWDVLEGCRREGSLDQRIEPASMRVNALADLVARHPSLRGCCLNGSTAGRLYHRLKGLDRPALPGIVLPSTSPAHARMPLAEKLERWRAAILPQLGPASLRA
jgi:TDG/mug DNA glycosylase family protein